MRKTIVFFSTLELSSFILTQKQLSLIRPSYLFAVADPGLIQVGRYVGLNLNRILLLLRFMPPFLTAMEAAMFEVAMLLVK